MESHFVISAEGPWYELFYSLAFFITLVLLIYEGYRRKFPILKWILLLIITRFLFIVGTKLFGFTPEQWTTLLTDLELPHTDNKSLIGGLLLGGLGLAAGYYLLHFRRNISDAFAFVLPLGIAIQRLGCFAEGCCFGKVSDVPWAIQYPVQSLAHYHQFNNQLIGFGDTLSLPVHPVQLYEMVGMLAAIGILLLFRNKLRRNGSLFLLSLILIFAVRFIDEFFRDACAHTIGGKMVGVFNTTQLFVLSLVVLLSVLLFLRERRTENNYRNLPVPDLSLKQAFLLFAGLSLAVFSLSDWLGFFEKLVIASVFAVAVSIVLFRVIRNIYLSRLRWVYFAGLVFPFILMAQSVPQDSATVKKYTTIRVGPGGGDFDSRYEIGQGEGCDRVSNSEYFNHKYNLGAVGVDFSRENLAYKVTYHYGSDFIFGNYKQTRLSDNHLEEISLFSASPYIKMDSKWLGMGGGFHVGNLAYALENKSTDGRGIPTEGFKKTPVYPRLYARLGKLDVIFIDYHLADHFPSSLPGFRQQLGIGSGFGTDFLQLCVGSNTVDMTYLSGSLVIKDKIVLEPSLIMGKSIYDDSRYYQYSIGLGYRFGHQQVRVLKK